MWTKCNKINFNSGECKDFHLSPKTRLKESNFRVRLCVKGELTIFYALKKKANYIYTLIEDLKQERDSLKIYSRPDESITGGGLCFYFETDIKI